MHACIRVLREPINYAESPSSKGTSVPNLGEDTVPLRAVEPARARDRSMRCQAHRSAHRCRGPPSPRRHQRTHFVSASAFRARPARDVCRECPALFRASVVSRERFTLYSAVSLSLAFEHRCHPMQNQEIPKLGICYCDSHRHPLSTIPSSARPRLASAHDSLRRRFRCVDAPEHVNSRGRTSSGTIHGLVPVAVGVSAAHRRAARFQP